MRHTYSKQYSITYLLSFSKVWLEFLTKNTTVKVIKRENKINILSFFAVSFNVFGKLGIVELGSLHFLLLAPGMLVVTLCDSLFIR